MSPKTEKSLITSFVYQHVVLHKPAILVVISVLVVVLVYSSYPRTDVFALACELGDYTGVGDLWDITCCEVFTDEDGIEMTWCTDCTLRENSGNAVIEDCGPRYQTTGDVGAPPPPIGQSVPLQEGGDLQQQPLVEEIIAPEAERALQQQSPSEEGGEGAQPLTRGQGVLPQDGILQQQQQGPADQGTSEPSTAEPATVKEEPPVPVCQEGLEFNENLGFCVPTECPEGQELNEETGICVLEEQQPAAAQQAEEQEQQTEEEQPSEESGSEEENGNN